MGPFWRTTDWESRISLGDGAPEVHAKNAAPVPYLANGAPDTVLAPRDTPSARPIPIRDLAAAAGGGAVDLDETILGQLYFRREWLDRQAIGPTQADVIKGRGESMEPTVPDRCSILTDRRRRAPRSGGIYVVRTDEGIVVKRACGDGGRWILSSDHRAWPPRPWRADAELIGEVRWMARTFGCGYRIRSWCCCRG